MYYASACKLEQYATYHKAVYKNVSKLSCVFMGCIVNGHPSLYYDTKLLTDKLKEKFFIYDDRNKIPKIYSTKLYRQYLSDLMV